MTGAEGPRKRLKMLALKREGGGQEPKDVGHL